MCIRERGGLKVIINFYEETIDVLKDKGKTMDDVVWIGGNSFEMPKENFIELARKQIYDSGYGGQEMPRDIKIVGKDFWLERAEYDGSEWWEYKEFPIRPNEIKIVTKLSGAWDVLGESEDLAND